MGLEIRSIKRLIAAVSNPGNGSDMMRSQVRRIQERLTSGFDTDGKPFVPYVSVRPTNRIRPLAEAAPLFDETNYDSTHTSTETLFKGTITGEAAKIARYQNFKRRFLGYSARDKLEAKEDLLDLLKKNMQQQR